MIRLKIFFLSIVDCESERGTATHDVLRLRRADLHQYSALFGNFRHASYHIPHTYQVQIKKSTRNKFLASENLYF